MTFTQTAMDGHRRSGTLLRMVQQPQKPSPNRLREWREAAGLSQEDLAERLGTTAQTISRKETGARTLTLDELDQIAPVLGCRPADLLADGDSVLSEEERRLLRAYSELEEADRQALLQLARSLSGQPGPLRLPTAKLRRKIAS